MLVPIVVGLLAAFTFAQPVIFKYQSPAEGFCNAYDFGGVSHVHWYMCCNNCNEEPNTCDETTYQGGSTGEYCGPCGNDTGTGLSRLLSTFRCGGCKGQNTTADRCAHWYMGDFPLGCWMYWACFEINCLRLSKLSKSLDLADSYCGDGICDSSESADDCPLDCCHKRNPNVCPVPNPNQCSRECCGEPSCCGGCQADLILVVDRSESVDDDNFDALKKFLVDDFTNLFHVDGDNQYRFSVVTFSGDVKVEFYLGELKNNAEVASRIQQIEYYHPGATNTSGALNVVLRDVLNPANYKPINGSNTIVILFTDGPNDVGGDPKIPAEELRMGPTNATIVSVGIGPFFAWSEYKIELISISGSEDLVYLYEDFTHLGNQFVEFINSTTCKSTTETKRN